MLGISSVGGNPGRSVSDDGLSSKAVDKFKEAVSGGGEGPSGKSSSGEAPSPFAKVGAGISKSVADGGNFSGSSLAAGLMQAGGGMAQFKAAPPVSAPVAPPVAAPAATPVAAPVAPPATKSEQVKLADPTTQQPPAFKIVSGQVAPPAAKSEQVKSADPSTQQVSVSKVALEGSGQAQSAPLTTQLKSLLEKLEPLLVQLQQALGGSGSPSANQAPMSSGSKGLSNPVGNAASTGAPTPTNGPTNSDTAKGALTETLQKLLTALNNQVPSSSQNVQPTPASQSASAPQQAPAMAPQSKIDTGSSSQTGQSTGSGSVNPTLASMVQKVMTLLERMLSLMQTGKDPGASQSTAGVSAGSVDKVGATNTPGSGNSGDLAPLIKQLIPMLQQYSQSGGSSTSNLGAGGQQGVSKAQAPATPSYNPSMGISTAEIDAMISHANGTGPAVNYEAWAGGSAPGAQSSSTSGGQVSKLGSQVGNEAA